MTEINSTLTSREGRIGAAVISLHYSLPKEKQNTVRAFIFMDTNTYVACALLMNCAWLLHVTISMEQSPS
jgi:hypothetical protein